ncbi:hypothetical protein GUJ93_ZPchr0013g33956 [Zizania palustris]|uniref:Uncharacterized protein n=1 Tax=Zizania palustris TaxID=103762 RepID=A0A8J5X2U7_ZIZPA|nr:hypothetical protein GUJ93_ZPchr0013g33956 [Zizania palustris]
MISPIVGEPRSIRELSVGLYASYISPPNGTHRPSSLQTLRPPTVELRLAPLNRAPTKGGLALAASPADHTTSSSLPHRDAAPVGDEGEIPDRRRGTSPTEPPPTRSSVVSMPTPSASAPMDSASSPKPTPTSDHPLILAPSAVFDVVSAQP